MQRDFVILSYNFELCFQYIRGTAVFYKAERLHICDAFLYLTVEETALLRNLTAGLQRGLRIPHAPEERMLMLPVLTLKRRQNRICIIECSFSIIVGTFELLDNIYKALVAVLVHGAVPAEHHEPHVLVKEIHASGNMLEILRIDHVVALLFCCLLCILKPLGDIRAFLGTEEVHHVPHGTADFLVVIFDSVQYQATIEFIPACHFRDLLVECGARAHIHRHGTRGTVYMQAACNSAEPDLGKRRE